MRVSPSALTRRLVAVMGITGVVVCPVARADEKLVELRRPSSVSAYNGWIAYSSYDSATARYHLTLKSLVDGTEQRPTVAARRVPFDVDLGPGANGGVVAMYSRCRQEPTLSSFLVPLPDHATGRGCDLYQYNPGLQRERRLALKGSPEASEFLPTIWGRWVAFARVYERAKGKRKTYPYLFAFQPGAKQPPRRLPGGPRGNGTPQYPARSLPNSILGMDLARKRLVFAWFTRRGRLAAETDSDIRVSTLGGEQRLVDQYKAQPGLEDEDTLRFSPALVDGTVYYGGGVPARSSSSNRAWQASLATGDKRNEVVPDGLIWTAVDRGRVLYSTAAYFNPSSSRTCQPYFEAKLSTALACDILVRTPTTTVPPSR